MENFLTYLSESGLSKIWQQINSYDCAMISAFRSINKDCINQSKNDNQKLTYKDKMIRNKELYAILMGMNVGVTRIDGSFVEGFGMNLAKEVKENTFFVVNLNNIENFFEQIIKLGKYFCQDSVLLKPKNDQIAYLYGTNLSEFPGLDQKANLNTFKGGIESQFMSRIHGRPFTFSESKDYNVATRGVFFSKAYKQFVKNMIENKKS